MKKSLIIAALALCASFGAVAQTTQKLTATKASEYGGGSSGTVSATGSSGSGGAHNNTQPYEICYMWRRTA